MQDKYPQDFDEQYISQAWLNMKQLLDKEMPVQPKRRPIWWVWLLAGLLLTAIMGGGAYYLYHQGQKTEPAGHSSMPAASLQASPSLPAEPTPLSNAKEGKPEKITRLKKGNQGPETGLSTAIASTGGSEVLPPGETSPLSSTVPAKEAKALKSPLNSDAPEERREGAPALSTMPSVLSAMERRWDAPLHVLPANIPHLAPVARKDAVVETNITPARKHLGLRLAVEGNATLLGHSFFDGLGGGLALEARPTGSRLYWRTGAFFRSFRPEASTGEQALRLENSFFKELQADGSTVNSTSLLLTSAIITEVRYVQVPVSAGFRLSPRLALEAGLQAGVLLSSQANSTWSLYEETSSTGGGQPAKPEIFEFKGKNANNRLKSTSLDLTASMAYRAGARTSLRVSYQYGLSDILEDDADKVFLRGLNLALAYYIIQ